MKPSLLARFAATAGLLLGLAAAVPVRANSPAPPPPPDLQVTVDVPPTWRPFLEEDIAEAFVSRLAEVFRRSGYEGRIAQVERPDEPVAGIPVLQIRLIEWRIDRTGHALCTFGAALKTDKGETSFGLVTDSAVFWPMTSGHWGMSRGFDQANALEDAAENALQGFYRKVGRSGLVPGLLAKN
jgi:hypothetical protein